MMTATTRNLIVIALVSIAAALLIALVTIALADDNSQTCPDGQTLSVAKVNGDKFTQGELPDGATITDSVSGSGLDYSLQSTKDSATLTVKGGKGTLTIECRSS